MDIKAAFESVDCLTLWKALYVSGTPPFLVQLLEDLYQGTTSHVRAGGKLSEPSNTTCRTLLQASMEVRPTSQLTISMCT